MNRPPQAQSDSTGFRLAIPSGPSQLREKIGEACSEWDGKHGTDRLWNRDPSLWTDQDEASWLGWLEIAATQLENRDRFRQIAETARGHGFHHALLLGMGGSSLCGEVLRRTLGRVEGYPDLRVLDSLNPAQIRSTAERCDERKALFIVSSKSGSTLEPNLLKDYFFHRARESVGPRDAGAHFAAITDPGSSLERVAIEDRYGAIYHGKPDIGGRFSALSDFGMVPAAVSGFNVTELLLRAEGMKHACGPEVPAAENPGILLGIALGVLARAGCDKVTILTSPGLQSLGGWLEQLVAESTGKVGTGLIPVVGEAIGGPDQYGTDRFFVYLRLAEEEDAVQAGAVASLERAGLPVACIGLDDPLDLTREFFRWEVATAVACSILKVNPFDQPDVEASKIKTRSLMTVYEESGTVPADLSIAEEDGLKLHADRRTADAIGRATSSRTIAGYLAAHLNRLGPGDYFALLPYIECRDEYTEILQSVRHRVRDRKKVATSVGFGPRYLHSTGQVHKGGPNSGLFLSITAEATADLSIPGRDYSFGIVEEAQALGDVRVLSQRGRRVLRVHIERDLLGGLKRLRDLVMQLLP